MNPAILGVLAKHAAGGDSYTGPLDEVPGATVIVAYGQRALSAAVLEGPIYTLSRISDDAQLSFSSEANGDAPVADIVAWKDALGVDTASIVLWRDHGGNGKNLTGIAGGSPWVANGSSSGRPAASVAAPLSNNTVTIPAGAITLVVVFAISGEGEGSPIVDYEIDGEPTGRASLEFGSFWVNPRDLFVIVSNAAGDTFCEFVTPGSVSEGRHVAVIKLDAAGACTLEVDGDPMTIDVTFGSPMAPPGANPALFKFPGPEESVYEAYAFSGTPNVTNVVTNIMTYYSIA